MMDNTVPWFLDRLKSVRSIGSGWQARCPSHPDKTPSLQIDRGGKGWLLYCHKGCSFSEIMGAMSLPLNAAFYDYDKPANPQAGEIDVAAREFFGTPWWSRCRKPHTFEDVGWMTYPVDFERWVDAGVRAHPEPLLPFEEGMRLWLTSGQVWLHAWLSERWLMNGGQKRIGWTEFSRWMHDQMWKAYLKDGCSASLCGESQSRDRGSRSGAHTTTPSTPSGSIG